MESRKRQVNYLRLSERDDASSSIERQRADLRDLAKREGREVVAELVDDGVSGRKERDAATEALDWLASGRADVLAVWKLDRFGRRGARDIVAIEDALDANRSGLFIAYQDGLRSDQAAWDIIAPVMAGVAKRESLNTGLRVASSIDYRRRAGIWSGGRVPYGLRAVGPEGARILVLDDREVAVVRDLADQVLKGTALAKLARQLNDRREPSPLSKARTGKGDDPGEWSTATLRKLLTGPHMRGYQTHRGELLRGDDGLPLVVWPPVLEPDVARALVTRLTPERVGLEPAPRARRQARLLSGVAYCVCGRKLYVRSDSAHASQAKYYCAAARNGQRCDVSPIAAGPLEEYAAGYFLTFFHDVPLMRREVVSTETNDGLADVEQAIRDTTARMARDDADVAALAIQLQALKSQRTELRGRPAQVVTRMVDTGLTIGEAWESGDLHDRRGLLLTQFRRVRVRGARRQSGKFDRWRVLIDPVDGPDSQGEEHEPVRLGPA